MARKPRNYYEGGIYHVIQRGNNKSYIFDEQLDKAMFCEFIKETMAELPFDLLYYVLMDSHYHLVLQMKEVSIGDVMHKINMSYSKFYNQKYGRCGTIFGSRLTSILVRDARHFMTLIPYVAYNPVKAKMVKHPRDYRWSAHLEVVSAQQFMINRQRMLSFFHSDDEKAVEIYEGLIDNLINGIPITDSVDQIKEKHQQVMRTLLRELVGSEELYQRVLSRERSHEVVGIKKKFIELATIKGFETIEIATLLNIAPRTVREHRARMKR
jgi:REP element-mobilizing transposase RayT